MFLRLLFATLPLKFCVLWLACPAWGGLVRVGTVEVDTEQKTVVATGWVNQVQGPVEYLAVGPKGKTHESVFVLDLRAADLHAALLLLGLEPGTPGPHIGTGPISGPAVRMNVLAEGRDPVSIEQFVEVPATSNAPLSSTFLFTGSVFEDGYYLAATEQSYVAVFWDPWAILNYELPAAGTNDEYLVVREGIVPPRDTSIRIEFSVE